MRQLLSVLAVGLPFLMRGVLPARAADSGTPWCGGQVTIYNNTQEPVWVCMVQCRMPSTLVGIASGDGSTEPGRVWVYGWCKIEPYGGFRKVPDLEHVLVVGPHFKRQQRFPHDRKGTVIQQGFPIRKNGGSINFYNDKLGDPYAKTWKGWGQLYTQTPRIRNASIHPSLLLSRRRRCLADHEREDGMVATVRRVP